MQILRTDRFSESGFEASGIRGLESEDLGIPGDAVAAVGRPRNPRL